MQHVLLLQTIWGKGLMRKYPVSLPNGEMKSVGDSMKKPSMPSKRDFVG